MTLCSKQKHSWTRSHKNLLSPVAFLNSLKSQELSILDTNIIGSKVLLKVFLKPIQLLDLSGTLFQKAH